MLKKKIVILGAGPAGISLACSLKKKKFEDFIVLEKEKEAGGLCRSAEVDHAPLDIGGGHFLDVRRPKVNQFLFSYMPEEEWNLYDRISRISFDGGTIDHPFEANIWQMSVDRQVEYLKSIAAAGCNTGEGKPSRFTDWIRWKLGDKIAEDYMLPYNQKMFGAQLDHLGTYWLEKLPDVSFEDTLRACLLKKPYGKQPGHAQFYYPKKYGYGELWKRMGEAVGGNLVCQAAVEDIDFDKKIVITSQGSFQADCIVSTVPWETFAQSGHLPQEIKEMIQRLKYSAVEIKYFEDRLDTDAHWIYYPSLQLSYHRILVRHNFAPGSCGYWTETNCDRMEKEDGRPSFRNEYAYPLNTAEKPELMKKILAWSREKGVIGLGRWGEHEHYNSDVVVEKAMLLSEELIAEESV